MAYRRYSTWPLYTCVFMLIFMVWIGGFTRLTTSGLSITEWNLVSGIIPPIGDSAWNAEFQKYKQTPEYNHINRSIHLDTFKRIYLTEYFHRIAGRLTGLAILFTFLYFLLLRAPAGIYINLAIALILCLLQGIIGWYMVKSGLHDAPFVSHYRLSFHLLIALFILYFISEAIIYAQFTDKYNQKRDPLINTFVLLVIAQTGIGGLVAGLKAGLLFNTFPLMENNLIPYHLFPSGVFFTDDPLTVQFLHRLFGVVVFFYALFISTKYNDQRVRAIIIALITFLQFSFGIITLLSHVNIVFASMHQVVAFLLFFTAVTTVRR